MTTELSAFEFVAKYWGFFTSIGLIVGWFIKLHYDFLIVQKNMKATEVYLQTFQKKNEDELSKLELNHKEELKRIESKHEISMKEIDGRLHENAEKQFMRLQLVERDTENRLLKVQQEHANKYENVNSKLEDLYKIVSKISTNFEHIAKTLDELKAAQSEQTKFNMELLKTRANQ